MQVFYSTPFQAGDIGAGLNDFCALVPDDAWVCLRDADTLFLTSQQQAQIQAIIDSNPPFELIGCLTNRLRAPYQLHDGAISDESDIQVHIDIAERLQADRWGLIKPCAGPVAGMFMLFRKSLWNQIRFRPRTIYFDKLFSCDAQRLGARLGIAQGIYLFHLYRFGKPDPCNHTAHLKSALESSPLAFERFIRTSSRRPTQTP
jgi:hypothetical protein